MKKIKFDLVNNALFEYNKDSGITLKEHLLKRFDHDAIRNAKNDKELWEIIPQIVLRKTKKMPDERAINKKLEELLSTKQSDQDMEEVLFTERSEPIDLSPEELKEVKEAIGGMLGKKEDREAQKPQPKWKWKFYGIYLFQALLFLVEYLFLASAILILVPISINISVTIIQALSITTLLTILRQWWK